MELSKQWMSVDVSGWNLLPDDCQWMAADGSGCVNVIFVYQLSFSALTRVEVYTDNEDTRLMPEKVTPGDMFEVPLVGQNLALAALPTARPT